MRIQIFLEMFIYESEETEQDDGSIPPYSSANFEDVLHKTEDEWNGYLARMIIRLPQGENIMVVSCEFCWLFWPLPPTFDLTYLIKNTLKMSHFSL